MVIIGGQAKEKEKEEKREGGEVEGGRSRRILRRKRRAKRQCRLYNLDQKFFENRSMINAKL